MQYLATWNSVSEFSTACSLRYPTPRAEQWCNGWVEGLRVSVNWPNPFHHPALVHETHSCARRSGLIRTAKSGRVRTCILDADRLTLVDDWLDRQRGIWLARTDRLEDFVTKPK